jgi:plastocyanin
MTRRIGSHRLAGLLVTAALLTAVGCSGGDAPASPTSDSTSTTAGSAAEVRVNMFIFQPKPLRVGVGETVTFEQEDPTIHTVTAGTRDQPRPEDFDVALEKGQTFEVAFDEPGSYPYHCTIHVGPGMEGEIIVEE